MNYFMAKHCQQKSNLNKEERGQMDAFNASNSSPIYMPFNTYTEIYSPLPFQFQANQIQRKYEPENIYFSSKRAIQQAAYSNIYIPSKPDLNFVHPVPAYLGKNIPISIINHELAINFASSSQQGINQIENEEKFALKRPTYQNQSTKMIPLRSGQPFFENYVPLNFNHSFECDDAQEILPSVINPIINTPTECYFPYDRRVVQVLPTKISEQRGKMKKSQMDTPQRINACYSPAYSGVSVYDKRERMHTYDIPIYSKVFTCPTCHTRFNRKSDYLRHIREQHRNPKKKFVCAGKLYNGARWGCGKRFSRKDQLKRHLHSRKAQLKCLKNIPFGKCAFVSGMKIIKNSSVFTFTPIVLGPPSMKALLPQP